MNEVDEELDGDPLSALVARVESDVEGGMSKETDFLDLDSAGSADAGSAVDGGSEPFSCSSSSIFARRRNRSSSPGSNEAISSSRSCWIWVSDIEARWRRFSSAMCCLSS